MGKKMVTKKLMPKVKKKPSKVPSYLYVTSVDQVESIMSEGLKGSRTPRFWDEFLTMPTIFLNDFNARDVIDWVAKFMMPDQYIKEYAILQVSADGIVGPVYKSALPEYAYSDKDEEFWLQLVVKQDVIDPKHITFLETRQIDYPGDEIFVVRQSVRRLRKWTPREWEIANSYLNHGIVAERMILEAHLDGRKLTEDEWLEFEDEAPYEMVLVQKSYESRLDDEIQKKAKIA